MSSIAPRRIAVVGSGVAGLTAAYVASRTAHVTLFEADDRLGGHADTHRVATPDDSGRKLLHDAASAMRLSARGFHRVLRVARTIADLAGVEQVSRIHVAEALSYRRQAPSN